MESSKSFWSSKTRRRLRHSSCIALVCFFWSSKALLIWLSWSADSLALSSQVLLTICCMSASWPWSFSCMAFLSALATPISPRSPPAPLSEAASFFFSSSISEFSRESWEASSFLGAQWAIEPPVGKILCLPLGDPHPMGWIWKSYENHLPDHQSGYITHCIAIVSTLLEKTLEESGLEILVSPLETTSHDSLWLKLWCLGPVGISQSGHRLLIVWCCWGERRQHGAQRVSAQGFLQNACEFGVAKGNKGLFPIRNFHQGVDDIAQGTQTWLVVSTNPSEKCESQLIILFHIISNLFKNKIHVPKHHQKLLLMLAPSFKFVHWLQCPFASPSPPNPPDSAWQRRSSTCPLRPFGAP